MKKKPRKQPLELKATTVPEMAYQRVPFKKIEVLRFHGDMVLRDGQICFLALNKSQDKCGFTFINPNITARRSLAAFRQYLRWRKANKPPIL